MGFKLYSFFIVVLLQFQAAQMSFVYADENIGKEAACAKLLKSAHRIPGEPFKKIPSGTAWLHVMTGGLAPIDWRSVDGFLRKYINTQFLNATLGDRLIVLDKKSRSYSADHPWAAKLRKVGRGDYTPDGPIAHQRGYTVQEHYAYYRKATVLVPEGDVPKNGFPVVLMSHGCNFMLEEFREKDSPYGGYNEARVVHALLENGYAVVFLEAEGGHAWQTNGMVVRQYYALTTDYYYIAQVLRMIRRGQIGDGKLNPDHKVALGISSGGYNSDRLANEFPGEFQAVIIHSAGYQMNVSSATDFNVRPQVSANQPPTLFIHGIHDERAPIHPALEYFGVMLDAESKVRAEIAQLEQHAPLGQKEDQALAHLYHRLKALQSSRFVILNNGHEWGEESPGIILDFLLKLGR